MTAPRKDRFGFEETKLRRAMLDAGLDSPALAEMAGVDKRSLQNLLSGCHRSWKLRARLNCFFKMQIFSPDFRRDRGRPRKTKPTNPHPTVTHA